LCEEKRWDFDSACGCGSRNEQAEIYINNHAVFKSDKHKHWWVDVHGGESRDRGWNGEMDFLSVIDVEPSLDEIWDLIDEHGIADIKKYYIVLIGVCHCLKGLDVSRRIYWKRGEILKA